MSKQIISSYPRVRQLVTNDIPTLWPDYTIYFANHAIESRSDAHHYVFPTMEHGVGSSSNRCGINIIQQFLEEPMTQPDTSCIEREPIIHFAILDEWINEVKWYINITRLFEIFSKSNPELFTIRVDEDNPGLFYIRLAD